MSVPPDLPLAAVVFPRKSSPTRTTNGNSPPTENRTVVVKLPDPDPPILKAQARALLDLWKSSAVKLPDPDPPALSFASQTLAKILGASLRGTFSPKRQNATGSPNRKPSPPISSRVLSQCEEEAMRSSYLALIKLPDARAQLVAVAQKVQSDVSGSAAFPKSSGSSRSSSSCWRVQTNESPPRLHSFDQPSQIVTIGRRTPLGHRMQMDVPLDFPAESGLSRLHAVVLPFPEKKCLLICDVGSLNGLCVIRQSNKTHGASQVETSSPGCRRLLIVGMAETAVLRLGKFREEKKTQNVEVAQLVINPKSCVVCLTHPREIVFGCGHFVCCAACTHTLEDKAKAKAAGKGLCPVCRVPIKRIPAHTVARRAGDVCATFCPTPRAGNRTQKRERKS